MDEVFVQAYLWVATASSVGAAIWVARRKLFGEAEQQQPQPQPAEKPLQLRRSPQADSSALASRRLSSEWDDEYDDYGDRSFGSDSYGRSPLDDSQTPPSAGSGGRRGVPRTPGSVRFTDPIAFSPQTEEILAGGRARTEARPVDELLINVVEHLDQTAAHALKTFYKYDSDKSGTLSVVQLADVLAELGLRVELDEAQALVEHMGVLSSGSVLDGEVLAIKAFLKGLKHARNDMQRAAAAQAAAAQAVAEPEVMTAEQAAAVAVTTAVDAVTAAARRSPTPPPAEDQQEPGSPVGRPSTAWEAATTRDGTPFRPRSAGRDARPRSQEMMEATTRRALDHYDAGCAHLDDGNWVGAEAELRKALTLQPNFPDCQRRLAALKRQQGEDAALSTKSSLGFTPQIERKAPPPSVVARATLRTPHGVNGPTVSSSRKSVGNLVATGRVVPASAPAGARWATAASPEREDPTPGKRVATPSLRAERRMEQLKAERGKEEVVQRLYGWESSKKVRIEEAQQAAAPTFTPQAYAATRRSEYYEHENEHYSESGKLVDRCYEWSQNREEWLKAKQEEQLRPQSKPKKNGSAVSTDEGGDGKAYIPTPKRYQRKAEAWASSADFVSRMADADKEKRGKLAQVRRDLRAKKDADEQKHLMRAQGKTVLDKEEGVELADRLFRWEAEKQRVLQEVRKEIRDGEGVEPTPQLDDASRAMLDAFDTTVPVTERLLHWHEVHNAQLQEKRAQTLAEDEADMTFRPKLGKTAAKVRNTRPLTKPTVHESLHEPEKQYTNRGTKDPSHPDHDPAKAAAEIPTPAQVKRDKARENLRFELEGLTVALLRKRAGMAGVGVEAWADAIGKADDGRLPQHSARGEHGWEGSIEHVAEAKHRLIEGILAAEGVPHTTCSFNKKARNGKDGFLGGPARNPKTKTPTAKTATTFADQKTRGSSRSRSRAGSVGGGRTTPVPRVALLSPTPGRRKRAASASKEQRKDHSHEIHASQIQEQGLRHRSPAQTRADRQAADDRVHFMRFNSAEKRRPLNGGPEICDDGKPLSLGSPGMGTPTRLSPGLAAARQGVAGLNFDPFAQPQIGTKIDRGTHTGAKSYHLSGEEKQQREVSNVFRVIRQEMGADRSLFGQKLGDAAHTFQTLDRDGNGVLSRAEFAEGLKRLDFGLTSAQQEEVLNAVDADGSGTVEWNEFMSRLQDGADFNQVTKLNLTGEAVANGRELNVKDSQEYFDKRAAESREKKAEMKKKKEAASKNASGSQLNTTRPKGKPNPLLKSQPKERLAQLSKPRARARDDITGHPGRKEDTHGAVQPLSPDHVPRRGAPKHRARRHSPNRAEHHRGGDVAAALSPGRSSNRSSPRDRDSSSVLSEAELDRVFALESARRSMAMPGLSSIPREKEASGMDRSNIGVPVPLRAAAPKAASGNGSGWTLDSFH